MGPEYISGKATVVPMLNANVAKTLIREHEKLSIKIFKRHGTFQRIMQIYHAVCHLAHFITHRLVQFST